VWSIRPPCHVVWRAVFVVSVLQVAVLDCAVFVVSVLQVAVLDCAVFVVVVSVLSK
jgi:hypothetical protein